jgi:hypothetical protein
MHKILKDHTISWKAKGVYLALVAMCQQAPVKRLQSNGPGYKASGIRLVDLLPYSREGIVTLRKVIEELKVGGYLSVTPERSEGRICGSIWQFPKEVSS